MTDRVISELKRIGIDYQFVLRLAKGKSDPEAYEPAGRLLSKVIERAWREETSPESMSTRDQTDD